MTIPVNSVLTAYIDLEQELGAFLDRVPFVPEHECVWSPSLATVILEACSQLDSFWKARSSDESDADIRQHFVRYGDTVAERWLVIWGDEGTEIMPFRDWKRADHAAISDYHATAWWRAYNALKHDRWGNIRSATTANAVNALGGVFLAIVRCLDCADALVSAEWFHSSYAREYALERYALGEHPESGITFESSLFSYAAGSSHPDFQRHLVCYRNCTHRFGRWLERKFDRSVVAQ